MGKSGETKCWGIACANGKSLGPQNAIELFEVALSETRAGIIAENYELHGHVHYLAYVVRKYQGLCQPRALSA